MTNVATQFKKGQSGNPKGRPKLDWSWSGLLKQIASEELGGVPMKEAIAKSLIKAAVKGNIQAIKEFGDRVEGKAKQALELTGQDGKPIDNNVTLTIKNV